MPDDAPQPDTNKGIIFWVVVTLAVNATVGVGTLAYVLVNGQKPDPVIFTAFVAIVNYVLGVLSGMLAKTSPTQTTSAVPVPIPSQVHVTNKPGDPVPTTTETKTP